jgi:LCP family protein required for cell wall assembly
MTRSDSYLQLARRRTGHHVATPPSGGRHRAAAPGAAAATNRLGTTGAAYLTQHAQALPRPYLPGWEHLSGRIAGAMPRKAPARRPSGPARAKPASPARGKAGGPTAGDASEVGRAVAAASVAQGLPALPVLPDDVPAGEHDEIEGAPTLHGELERVRRRQRSPFGRLHRRWKARRHKRAWTVALIGTPLILLTVLGLTIGPVVLEGTRAYQKVFVDPLPRESSSLLPVDGNGTPTIQNAGGEEVAAAADTDWNGTEPLLMLLIGVDQQTEFESRSDTMILVWVDPVAKEAAMLPLPRDLKVIVPGFGIHKINAAYAIGEAQGVEGGGPALTVQTIEANFGLRIDHFAQVNFDGFVSVVDLLGGVTLDVPYPIKDNEYPAENHQYTRVYFPAGWQHMDGERALQYARTRHADNDAQRSIRQQQVLLALREQADIGDLIPKAAELLHAFGDSVRTDLKLDQAIKLARLATEIPLESIEQYTLLNSVEEEDPLGIYYLVPNWEQVGEVLSQFTRSTVSPPAAALNVIDYDIPIRVENGTLNPGLAQRVSDVLVANGFTNVTYAQNDNAGLNPTSTFVDTSGNIRTASLVAGIVGLSPEVIDEQYAGPEPMPDGETSSPPAVEDPALDGLTDPSGDADTSGDSGGTWVEPTPEVSIARPQRTTRTTGEIVIVLGDDAFDPAWYVETAGG